MKRFIYGALLSATLAAPAFAGPELIIENFVGTVKLETSTASKISVTREDNMKGVNLYSDGDSLKIDGDVKKPDGNKCKGYYGSYNIGWFKKESNGEFGGYEDLEDYPQLTVKVPENATLIIRNSIPFLTASTDLAGADIDMRYCGKVYLDNITEGLRANIRGSGDLEAKDAGSVDVVVKGSGDVTLRDAGLVKLSISGSGDAELRNVGATQIDISGSGDVELEKVDGALSVESAGSGDVEVGDVAGDFVYDGRGSGDADIASVTGRISIDVAGSGDVDIDGGETSILQISSSGASNVSFDGVAQNADLYASGASDIYVTKVTGEVRSKERGAADITVND